METKAVSLEFSVKSQEPILVAPSKPTPYEFKCLSDIDDQPGFRLHTHGLNFYASNPRMEGRDPAQVVRKALADALVFYYPLAGRLREKRPGRKLVVECTGEGVLFLEADADVRLEEFGPLHPPFPCLEQLMLDVPGYRGILNSPLLLIQVTRLACGGFVFALRQNHTLSDAAGLAQLIIAMGELARGAAEPSLLPVWERHLLNARHPPHITCLHPEYPHIDHSSHSSHTSSSSSRSHRCRLQKEDDVVIHRSFFFGPREMSALRMQLPPHLRPTSSTFNLVTACLWRCRTIALGFNLEEEVRVLCIVNARSKYHNRPLPPGYYGNICAFAAAVSPAGKLRESPICYAEELIREAKERITEEYMQSVADLMAMRGHPLFVVEGSFLVSDVRRMDFWKADFGWGKAVYGGPAKAGVGTNPVMASFYVGVKNGGGEEGILVPICLPRAAMERFSTELQRMIRCPQQEPSNSILSTL